MKHARLLLGCLIVITSSALQAMPQSRTRNTVVPQLVTNPIRVTTPAINAPKSRSNGWITQTIVQVENVSNKPIEYLTIEATLPGVTEPFMLAYGQQPGKPAVNNVTPLQPGAKIDLRVDYHTCELSQRRLLAIAARSLAGNHATARINGVIFNDRTAWFDGLPHVMEPNNPLRWTIVRSTSAVTPNELPMFGFLKVGFRENNNPKPSYDLCWERWGTEWVDCCGLQRSSAILVQAFGGIWEPLQMGNECCQWIKQVDCSNPPW